MATRIQQRKTRRTTCPRCEGRKVLTVATVGHYASVDCGACSGQGWVLAHVPTPLALVPPIYCGLCHVDVRNAPAMDRNEAGCPAAGACTYAMQSLADAAREIKAPGRRGRLLDLQV